MGLLKLMFHVLMTPFYFYCSFLIVTIPNLYTNTHPVWNKTWWIAGGQWVALIIISFIMIKEIYNFACK